MLCCARPRPIAKMFSPKLTLLVLNTLVAVALADILVIGHISHPTPQARDVASPLPSLIQPI